MIRFLVVIICYSCTFITKDPKESNKDFNRFILSFKEYNLPTTISTQELGKYIILGDYESDIDSLDVINFLLPHESIINYNTYNEVYKKGIRYRPSNNTIMLVVPKTIYNRTSATENIEIGFYLFKNSGKLITQKTIGTIDELTQLAFDLTKNNIVIKETKFIIKNDSITGTQINVFTYIIKDDNIKLK